MNDFIVCTTEPQIDSSNLSFLCYQQLLIFWGYALLVNLVGLFSIGWYGSFRWWVLRVLLVIEVFIIIFTACTKWSYQYLVFLINFRVIRLIFDIFSGFLFFGLPFIHDWTQIAKPMSKLMTLRLHLALEVLDTIRHKNSILQEFTHSTPVFRHVWRPLSAIYFIVWYQDDIPF